MRKIAFSILVFLLTGLIPATAQLYPYNWRIGVSAGYATYFGDMNPYRVNGFSESTKLFRVFDLNPNYITQPSFQISLETRLNKTVSLALKGGHYSFAMADRYVDRSGDLQTDTPRFIRSLNFKTDVTDVGFSLLFGADNGGFLNRKALLAPYFGIGAGVLWYDVYADLYDADGNPYDYSDLEVDYDGNYETALRPLRTESSSGYEQHAFYAEFSLGFRVRLAHRWELFVQSDLRYTTTDYLDDLSGRYRADYISQQQQYAANPIGMPEADGQNYRGNDDNLNDFYFYHSAGLKFSFAHAKESFRAPVITGQHWEPVSESQPDAPHPTEIELSEKSPEKKIATDSVKVDGSLEKVIKPTMRFLEEEMAMLQRQQREYELAMQEDSLLRQQLYLDSLENVLEAYLDSIPEDSLMQDELTERQRENEMLRLQLDSLEQQRIQLETIPVDTSTIDYDQPSAEPALTQRDTVLTLSETMRPAPDSLQQAEIQELKQKMERMQRQQSQRDSVIIMRLADLLENRPAVSTEKTVTERYYTDTSGVTQRSAPVTERYSPTTETGASSSEIEALRSEVRSLRQELAGQQPSTYPSDVDGSRENVVVVPGAPVIIRDGQRDTLSVDEYNAVVQERQRLQAENARLRDELSRKERQLDLFLDSPKVADTTDTADTLATDTLSAPIDSLEKTEPDTAAINEAEMLERLRETADRLEAENRAKERAEKAAKEAAEEAEKVVVEEESTKEPEPREKPDREPMQVNVFFALNSTTVKEADKAALKKAADRWKQDKSQQISLTSYADNTGNPEYNRQLCARRNDAVKKVLVDELGVDPAKIKTEIGGKVVRNGQAWNPDDRRVEVVVAK